MAGNLKTLKMLPQNKQMDAIFLRGDGDAVNRYRRVAV
jgi:hypothetical protein